MSTNFDPMKASYILFSFGVVMLGLQSCSKPTQAPPPSEFLVTTYQVSPKSVTGLDTYPATVVPLNEVEIRPQVSGYITRIFVQDGQSVKKGQALYEIDRSKYLANKNQALASLSSAQAHFNRIKKDVERYEKLDKNEAIARQVLDNARSELLAAEAQVKAAEAQVSASTTDYNYSLITAPFDGKIGISQVRLGAQVAPGQPLLNTISSVDPMQVDFVINEREIPRFTKLMNATDSPDSLFTLKLGDGSVYPIPGKLASMDRAVGRQSGTLNIRIQFPNPSNMLVPGMTTTLQVVNEDYGNQLVIPFKSVTEQMGEYYVYLVGQDSTVTQKTIQLGTVLGGEVVVREGLEPGQTIVLEGVQKLRQGAKVKLQ